MRQEEPTPWLATPSPRPPVEFKCPSDSEGEHESEVGGITVNSNVSALTVNTQDLRDRP